MPNAHRSGAQRKKAKASTQSNGNGGGAAANGASTSTSTGTFPSSPSFTFQSTGPTFPPSPSASTSHKKSFRVPSSSSSEEDDSEDASDSEDNDSAPDADEEEPPVPLDPVAAAAAAKDKGNVAFKSAKYLEAIRHYTLAIELDPSEPSYRTNRAAAYMAGDRKEYKKALEDCLAAVGVLEGKGGKAAVGVKTWTRLARCQIGLGLLAQAKVTLGEVVALGAGDSVKGDLAKVERIEKGLEQVARDRERKEWSMVLLGLEQVGREVEEWTREWRVWKIEALVGKKRYDEAAGLAADMLRANPNQPEALYFRGVSLYYLGNHAQAIAHAQSALRNDPDYTLARTLLKKVRLQDSLKEAGNEVFKAGKWEEAIAKYSEALAVDEDNVVFRTVVLSNRATAFQKNSQPDLALADCDACLASDPGYWKALRTRGRVHLAMEEFEASVRDFKAAYELAPAGSNDEAGLKREVKDAEVALKKSKMKDHYKTLGISSTADDYEIKKAYRRASLIHHPDKGGSDEKFKEVGEAYAILSDPARRRKFDSGIDENDPMSGMDSDFGGMGGFPGHSHGGMDFESMFGGGGGFSSGGFGGGGYGGRRGGNPYGF